MKRFLWIALCLAGAWFAVETAVYVRERNTPKEISVDEFHDLTEMIQGNEAATDAFYKYISDGKITTYEYNVIATILNRQRIGEPSD